MMVSHDFPDHVYIYTADDERLASLRWYRGSTSLEETWTLRDLGGKLLTTYGTVGGNVGTWTWQKDHIYRDGKLLAAETNEPWPRHQHHFVSDHLGTPRLVTAANGSGSDDDLDYMYARYCSPHPSGSTISSTRLKKKTQERNIFAAKPEAKTRVGGSLRLRLTQSPGKSGPMG